jgi:hypothetical protein
MRGSVVALKQDTYLSQKEGGLSIFLSRLKDHRGGNGYINEAEVGLRRLRNRVRGNEIRKTCLISSVNGDADLP